MTKHTAGWRFPTEKQMKTIVREASREPTPAAPIKVRRLGQITGHLLRLECEQCPCVIDIQTSDAVRLCGAQASLRDLAKRLQKEGCRGQAGDRDDGCWPFWRIPEDEGKLAASDGIDVDKCPYPIGTAEHREWRAGYDYVFETCDDGEGDDGCATPACGPIICS